jgi:hypothetical protein
VRLPPPRVRAVTTAPLTRRRCHLHRGMEAVNDEDRCLYAGTLWEAEVVTNC